MSHELKNQWGSTLHTVVGHIADNIPVYVIRNEKGKEKVLHRALLLLWSSAEEKEEGILMTTAQLTIFISLLELEPLPNGEERCRVPYEWSISRFGLNLASFQPMPEAPELKTGPQALATYAETSPQEGVGQRDMQGEETNSTRDGNAIQVDDAPP